MTKLGFYFTTNYQVPSTSGCEAIQKNQLTYEMSIDGGQSFGATSGEIKYLQAYMHYNIRVRAVNDQNVIGSWETLTLRTISTGNKFKNMYFLFCR